MQVNFYLVFQSAVVARSGVLFVSLMQRRRFQKHRVRSISIAASAKPVDRGNVVLKSGGYEACNVERASGWSRRK